MFKKLEAVAEKYDELTRLLSDPVVAADHQQYQKNSKERANIEEGGLRFRGGKDILKQKQVKEVLEGASEYRRGRAPLPRVQGHPQTNTGIRRNHQGQEGGPGTARNGRGRAQGTDAEKRPD